MTEHLNSSTDYKEWQRPLLPHSERAASVSADETISIVGTWTEEKIQGALDMDEHAEDSVSVKIMRSALELLPELDTEDGLTNALADKRAELEAELKESRGNVFVSTALRLKLAGLKHIQGEADGVEENIRLAAQGSESPITAKAAYINEIITEHNEWLGRRSESVDDSPEARQAQSNVDAKYGKMTVSDENAEGVLSDARSDVAKALEESFESESNLIVDKVAQASKGITKIYTDIPRDVELESTDGKHRPIDGFNSFGDGLAPNGDQYRNNRLRDTHAVEAVVFKPTDEGVRVSYQFDSNSTQYSLDASAGKVPLYTTQNGRGGNMLYVETVLSASLAEQFAQAVQSDPNAARAFAEKLVIQNGVSKELWDDVVSPPYGRLPSDWKQAINRL